MSERLEERLRRIEEKLDLLSARLRAIEELVAQVPGGDLLSFLIRALSLNVELQSDVAQAYRRVLRARKVLRERGIYDSITMAIVELLALYGPLNISRIAALLRRVRGRASRRTVSKKLRLLEEAGAVERVRGRGRAYRLSI